MELLNWSVRGIWKYKTELVDCTICKEKLTHPCINCIQNPNLDISCPVTKGVCSHVYHKHCIDNCLKTAKIAICPLDNIPWKTQI